MEDAKRGMLLARLIVTTEKREGVGHVLSTLSVRAAGRELVLHDGDGNAVTEWRAGGRSLPAPAFCAVLPHSGVVSAEATVQLVREWFEARPGVAVRFAELGPADYAEARRVYGRLAGRGEGAAAAGCSAPPAAPLDWLPVPPWRDVAFGFGWMDRQDGGPRARAHRLPPGVRESWLEGWDARQLAEPARGPA